MLDDAANVINFAKLNSVQVRNAIKNCVKTRIRRRCFPQTEMQKGCCCVWMVLTPVEKFLSFFFFFP